MKTEVLLHLDEHLNAKSRKQLVDALCEECGGSKPDHYSKKEHEIFVTYNAEKTKIHDIPKIALKHGVHVEIVC
ncbi:MAG: hypothetical protein OEX02_07650 [Cyclobacteriaceae bacterium]|nr:hypothetical protein [Cyclobacteriaceae bacterium]